MTKPGPQARLLARTDGSIWPEDQLPAVHSGELPVRPCGVLAREGKHGQAKTADVGLAPSPRLCN